MSSLHMCNNKYKHKTIININCIKGYYSIMQLHKDALLKWVELKKKSKVQLIVFNIHN